MSFHESSRAERQVQPKQNGQNTLALLLLYGVFTLKNHTRKFRTKKRQKKHLSKVSLSILSKMPSYFLKEIELSVEILSTEALCTRVVKFKVS